MENINKIKRIQEAKNRKMAKKLNRKCNRMGAGEKKEKVKNKNNITQCTRFDP